MGVLGTAAELEAQFGNDVFQREPGLVAECQSIQRIFSISVQELFFQWEAYCLRDGGNIRLSSEQMQVLKQDMQETLVRQSAAKKKSSNSKDRHSSLTSLDTTPRSDKILLSAGPADIKSSFLDSLSPTTPDVMKRRYRGQTHKSSPIADTNQSPHVSHSTPFAQRKNAGRILETLNGHIQVDTEFSDTLSQSRVRIVLNVDSKKFAFRTMHQKLMDVSDVLDDRVDTYASLFGNQGIAIDDISNPALPSQSEVVAVGRILLDSAAGRLNSKSVLLETSRRLGGVRIPLNLDNVPSFSLFPGQVVAVRGTNVGAGYLTVSNFITPESPPMAVTSVKELSEISQQLNGISLRLLVSSGPYTLDSDLEFEPLAEICAVAEKNNLDCLILIGPFVDADHPLIQTGDYDLKDKSTTNPLDSLFQEKISSKLRLLTNTMIIMIPSIRDACSRHICWPQSSLDRRLLDLPKNVKCLPNPALFSLNEISFAVSSHDPIKRISAEECSRNPEPSNILARSVYQVIYQRHFYPIFPGTFLDVPHLALAELVDGAPDVLILPGELTPFAKIVNNVVAINPGFAAKRLAAGSYGRLTIKPPDVDYLGKAGATDKEGMCTHRVWERIRVDIQKV